MIRLEFPFPPSVNNYWRTASLPGGQRRTILSKKGREYQGEVKRTIYRYATQVAGFRTFVDPLKVTLALYLPDRRQRDIDNYCKGLFDSCTKAGLWSDDSLIQVLTITKIPFEPGTQGYCLLEVETL